MQEYEYDTIRPDPENDMHRPAARVRSPGSGRTRRPADERFGIRFVSLLVSGRDRIAFRSESRNQTLRVMDSDGSGLAPLGPDNSAYMMQQWSPDGTTIVVSDGNDLYAIPLEDPAAPASPGFGIVSAAGALFLTVCLLKLRKEE